MIIDNKITKIIGGGVRNSGSTAYGQGCVEQKQ